MIDFLRANVFRRPPDLWLLLLGYLPIGQSGEKKKNRSRDVLPVLMLHTTHEQHKGHAETQRWAWNRLLGQRPIMSTAVSRMELRPSPDIGKLNALRDPILANTAVLEEYRSRFLIRELDKGRFAQVISSVTSRSVLSFGIVTSETREATGTEAPFA